jgi:hypothetical protein
LCRASIDKALQLVVFSRVHALCTIAGTKPFELRHHLEYLKQLFQADLGYEAA